MSINRRHGDFEFLILRWSIENHTFVVAWGEFGLTLKDVVALTMVPLYEDTRPWHRSCGLESLLHSGNGQTEATNKTVFCVLNRMICDEPKR